MYGKAGKDGGKGGFWDEKGCWVDGGKGCGGGLAGGPGGGAKGSGCAAKGDAKGCWGGDAKGCWGGDAGWGGDAKGCWGGDAKGCWGGDAKGCWGGDAKGCWGGDGGKGCWGGDPWGGQGWGAYGCGGPYGYGPDVYSKGAKGGQFNDFMKGGCDGGKGKPKGGGAVQASGPAGKGGRGGSKKVFVGGIAKTVSEDVVRDALSQFGVIEDVKMLFDKDGVSKGYCFVTFQKSEDAQKVYDNAQDITVEGARVDCKPSEGAKAKPGDWYCGMCGDLVFASKASCSMCGYAGPLGTATPMSAQVKPGDWICSRCGDLVFASKDACMRCGTTKELGKGLGKPKGGCGGKGKFKF